MHVSHGTIFFTNSGKYAVIGEYISVTDRLVWIIKELKGTKQ
jgi:hypothetical protein